MIRYVSSLSLGDFVIDCHAISKSSFKDNVQIIAPSRFEGLYEVLDPPGLNIVFFDDNNLATPPALFSLRTASFVTIIQDSLSYRRQLRKYISSNIPLYALYSATRWRLLSGMRVNPVECSDGNTYRSLYKFFDAGRPVNPIQRSSKSNDVMIFPGSRQSQKVWDLSFVKRVVQDVISLGFKPIVAVHRSEYNALFDQDCCFKEDSSLIVFENFHDLKTLVLRSSNILTSDSLPVHFSNYFDVMPFVISNRSHPWIYPDEVLRSKSYTTFDRYMPSQLAEYLV